MSVPRRVTRTDRQADRQTDEQTDCIYIDEVARKESVHLRLFLTRDAVVQSVKERLF